MGMGRAGDYYGPSLYATRVSQSEYPVSIGIDNPVGGPMNATTGANVGKWFYWCFAWLKNGDYNVDWRCYIKPAGGIMTAVGGLKNSTGVWNPDFLNVVCNVASSDGQPAPCGAYGGISIYALSSLADAATYPNDILAPGQSFTWKVNASTGSDSNDGITQPWQTSSKVTAEIALGTITAGQVVDETGAPATCAATFDDSYTDAKTWCDGYDAGNRLYTGDRIQLLSSIGLTTPISFYNSGKQIDGASIEVAASATVDNFTTLTSWTRPDAGGAPNVWAATGDFADSVNGYSGGTADGVRLQWIPGANFAAVKATLNSTPGGQYADATNFYIYSATNPNSNGVTYKATIPLEAGNVLPAMFGMQNNLMVLNTGASIVGGPMWNTDGTAAAQYCVAVTSPNGNEGNVSVIQGGTIRAGSKHAVGQVSNGDRGMVYRTGASILDPNENAGDYYADVIYSGSGDAPDIHQFAVWRGCTVPGILYGHVASGSDPAFGYQAITGTYGEIAINNVYPGEADPPGPSGGSGGEALLLLL